MTTKLKEKNASVSAALSFLCKRNPFDEIQQSDWVFLLMEYQEKKGDEALEALAGFFIYAVDNIEADKKSQAINSTFAHDLNGRNDEFMSPRSSSYIDYWRDENKRKFPIYS